MSRADNGGNIWFTIAGTVVGGALGAASKLCSNILTGKSWNDGLLGAIVSGAVYGGIATSPILRTAAGAHVNAIASYASAAAEAVVNETITYFNGKSLTADNLTKSVASVAKNTIVEGTQTYAAGKLAGRIVKTNSGWFRPTKFSSATVGTYAKKVWKQSAVQAGSITISNTVRGWMDRLWKR